MNIFTTPVYNFSHSTLQRQPMSQPVISNKVERAYAKISTPVHEFVEWLDAVCAAKRTALDPDKKTACRPQ